MFILKFNKMIHNKWIWGGFAFLVAFLFVGADLMPGGRRGMRSGAASQYGTIKGIPVEAHEYNLAHEQVRLMSRDGRNDMDIEQETWKRLAEARFAGDLGLAVSEDELLDVLRSDPTFAGADGQFSRERYRLLLANRGLSEDSYAGILRNDLLMFKLQMALASGTWVSPSVVAEYARSMTDVYTYLVATIPGDSVAKEDLTVTEEEIENCYALYQEAYRVPERMSVRYVEFPFSAYREKLKDSGAEQKLDAPSDGDAGQETGALGDRDAPATTLAEDARGLAIQDAYEFADLFLDSKRITSPEDFDRIAAERGLTVQSSGLFSLTDPPIALRQSREFVAAAFELAAEPLLDRFSDVIVSRNAAYVLAFETRKESYMPELQDVRDSVKGRALDIAQARLQSEFAEKKREGLLAEMEKGASFADACATVEVAVAPEQTFTMAEMYAKDKYGTMIALPMRRLNDGDVSSVIAAEKDSLIIHVVKRSRGDDVQTLEMSSNISSQMRRALMQTVFEEWRNGILSQMDVQSRRLGHAVPAPEAGDDDY